jgi:histidinol-phosphate aminotransferase
MYEVSASINDIAIKRVNLTEDFQLRPKEILAAVNENTKIIFICSPNNPSGNKMKREAIREILLGFEGLVVVDEAYIDFSDEESFTTELSQFPNLLVMQTFSKAWGLANLRIGMAFASEEIIRILNLIKPPYNISGLTQEKVLASLEKVSEISKVVKVILEEREHLQKDLEDLPFVKKIYPSHANFLLVKVPDAKKMYDDLVSNKIIVRDRSKVVLCEDCLRITVGTRKENEAFLKSFKKLAALSLN